jgi:NADH:ubiquinone oxidoreductase subunit 4 (subunit M)
MITPTASDGQNQLMMLLSAAATIYMASTAMGQKDIYVHI